MRQSFSKTIQGHLLKFNRLLYPLRYNISNADLEKLGMVISMSKDQKGGWAQSPFLQAPGWFNEITSSIDEAIIENESPLIRTESLFTDLF